eukprot:SAG25_NODE_3605_length_1025_cov_1.343413_1_plen_91_part_00
MRRARPNSSALGCVDQHRRCRLQCFEQFVAISAARPTMRRRTAGWTLPPVVPEQHAGERGTARVRVWRRDGGHVDERHEIAYRLIAKAIV